MGLIGPRCLAARCRLAHVLLKDTQPLRLPCGHLDHGQLLATGHKQNTICRATHLKLTPETNFSPLLQPALNLYAISKAPGLTVIDFGPDHDGINLCLRHMPQIEAEFSPKFCPASLDHSQIGKVMHDPTHVGVVEHHFILSNFPVEICLVFLHGANCSGPEPGGKRLRETKW